VSVGDISSDTMTGGYTHTPSTGQTHGTKNHSSNPDVVSVGDLSSDAMTGGTTHTSSPGQTHGTKSHSSNRNVAESRGPDQTHGRNTDSNDPDQTTDEPTGGNWSAGSTGGDSENTNIDAYGGSNKSDVLSRDESNNPKLVNCDRQNSTTSDCDGQLETTNTTRKSTSGEASPLQYKILLVFIGLALLSVICACICTASLRHRKGKEALVERKLLPDHDPSDMEK